MLDRNQTVAIGAAATLAFVLGFGYGDLLGGHYGFDLRNWQTLVSATVALGGATLAYFGVRSTQRVTVMLKEEERIDRALPGLRQTHVLLDFLLAQLDLPPQLLHVADQAIRNLFRPRDGETYQAVVERMIPLTDEETRSDVTAAIFLLSNQAGRVKAMKDEVDRTEIELADINAFAPNFHQAVRGAAERAKAAYDREVAGFLSTVEGVKKRCSALRGRITEAEERRKVIRWILEQYFRA
jgi:hypothetical protein